MQNPSSYTVYSASAGSGKTFTLVKEYLQILLQSDDVFYFQKILAITFTNKAAAEMKQRVIDALQDFATGKETDLQDVIKNEIGLTEKEIQAKSKRIINAILHDYSALSITTIDSFTHRIIRSFAYDFGLSMDFDIEMDVKTLLHKAVNNVIAKIGLDKELTEVLIQFALTKSDDDKSWDITQLLNKFAGVLLNETDKIAFKALNNKNFQDYKALTKSLYKRINELDVKIQEAGNKGLEIIAKSGLEDQHFTGAYLPKFLVKLSQNKVALKYFNDGTIKRRFEDAKMLNKKGQELQNLYDAIETVLWQIYNESEGLIREKELLKLFNESVVPLSVLSYINNALENIKEDENTKTISEFNELIFDKIQDQPAPFIYERIGEKYKHFFIDEMQDTSILQWKNLIKLIENQLSQGGSLLLVGDAKQAIYRWRGGASEQFIKLADPTNNQPFNIPKKIANLETNFRSHEAIIDFNNSFFQHISTFLQDASYKDIYQQGNAQKKNAKKGGYVQLDFLENDKTADENDLRYPKKVLEIIQELDTSFCLKDVCILVRKRQQGVAVAQYLIENNIDIISSETLLLTSDTQVDFLVNQLYHLHNISDKESRLKILNFLYKKFNISEEKHTFYESHVHLDLNIYYLKLKEIGIHFNPEIFFKKTLYDAVEYSIRAFGITQNANAYVQYFLDEVLGYQNKNGSDLAGFLDFWEQHKDKLSISISGGKNAVQIMTIHKAKGLQFPVVIFPYDLNIYFQIDPKIWYPISHSEDYQGFEKLLIPYRASLEYINKTSHQLFTERRKILELDAFNLLYVALTRAEEQLYIISDYKFNKDGVENLDFFSGLFINHLKTQEKWENGSESYSYGDRKRNIKVTEKLVNIARITTNSFISTDITDQQVNTYNKEAFLWNTEQGKAIDYGNLVHEILAHIYTQEDIDLSIQNYVNIGLISVNELGKMKRYLSKVIQHSELSKYYQSNLKVYNERPILTQSKDIIIPDRLVFSPNKTVAVIDYKTGKEESKHFVQIQKYAAALSDMGYVVSKKLLVYLRDDDVLVVG